MDREPNGEEVFEEPNPDVMDVDEAVENQSEAEEENLREDREDSVGLEENFGDKWMTSDLLPEGWKFNKQDNVNMRFQSREGTVVSSDEVKKLFEFKKSIL